MKLKTQFSLAFIANTILGLSLFGGTYFFVAQHQANLNQKREQARTLEKMSAICREMNLASNAIIAMNYISKIKEDPTIKSAACLDANNVVQAHSNPSLLGRHLSQLTNWQLVDVPIGGNTPPKAGIEYDPEKLTNDIRLEMYRTLKQPLLVALCTCAVAIISGLILAWSLSRPIGILADGARHIGAGQLDYQTSINSRNDEIGLLAQEINAMAFKLKGLDELKDSFISNVSHELRSPLSAITMYAHYMLEEDPDSDKLIPQHRKKLMTMMDNALRLNVFVTNVLDAAKIKAGKMDYHIETVTLFPVFERVKELYSIVALHQQTVLSVAVEPSTLKVRADAERLQQVIANLVSNVLKFTPAGGKVTIAAQLTEHKVIIRVSDTGKGIAKEVIKTLFKRFTQSDIAAQRSNRIQGTGLGLYIVAETLEAMGANIRLESAIGQGTQAIIEFSCVS